MAMNSKKDEDSDSGSILSEQTSTNSSGIYIDDYSQLRLSYYQWKNGDSGSTSAESTFCETRNTIETELSGTSTVDVEEDERQKLREYYISQMPDLPHPAFTMASIISSASCKMGAVHLKYNERIEQGTKSDEDIEFVPQRRSTLKPGQFPHN